ncbi:hypothetical protein F5I97DRAFT_954210 [Phlebopus sp. FC_14]|nr:hypothetical protein F5I97DRAFT_954210 [Phlebopus sp. FC_14]
MSVSIEDLVASLSTNHIGQEAIDLAALQAQLAQTLFTNQLSSPSFFQSPEVNLNSSRRDPSHVQHCTTPTARTPSSASTFSWPNSVHEHVEHVRKRGISSARRQSVDEPWSDLDEMDEERMVEDMIIPDSPSLQSAYPWASYHAHTNASTKPLSAPPPTSIPTPTTTSCVDSSSPSLFTSTDPFYIQVSQSAQQSHSSLFSHTGQPSTHSPFLVGHCHVPSWDG